jgi:hypothetical protein
MHMCAWLRQPAPAAASPLWARTTAGGILTGKQAGALQTSAGGSHNSPQESRTPHTPCGSVRPIQYYTGRLMSRQSRCATRLEAARCSALCSTKQFHYREAAGADA